MPSSTRPTRVPVRGARARVGDADADVVNVSRTGVLVRAAYPLRTGTEWPLTLEICHPPLVLTGKVVRCEPLADPSERHALPLHHELALQFLSMPNEARAKLSHACGRLIDGREEPPRLLPLSPLSLVRRCPRCRGTRVVKERRHHYYCENCERRFVGLKVGPVRLAF